MISTSFVPTLIAGDTKECVTIVGYVKTGMTADWYAVRYWESPRSVRWRSLQRDLEADRIGPFMSAALACEASEDTHAWEGGTE